MSVSSLSSSTTPAQHPAPSTALRRAQPPAGDQGQLNANGLPRSALNPSEATRTGRTVSGSASQRILDLHL